MDGPPDESESQRARLSSNPFTERFLADSNGINQKPMVAAAAAARAFKDRRLSTAQIMVSKMAMSDTAKGAIGAGGAAATMLAAHQLHRYMKRKKEEKEKGKNYAALMKAFQRGIQR